MYKVEVYFYEQPGNLNSQGQNVSYVAWFHLRTRKCRPKELVLIHYKSLFSYIILG